MEEHAAAHVGDGDGGHNDERADHEALRPGLERDLLRLGRLPAARRVEVAHCVGVRRVHTRRGRGIPFAGREEECDIEDGSPVLYARAWAGPVVSLRPYYFIVGKPWATYLTQLCEPLSPAKTPCGSLR